MPIDLPSNPSPHILLVEDDDDVRRSLTMLLKSWGYTVEPYRSGVELLSLRQVPTGDCLIVDYKMPDLDGLALLKQLKASGVTLPAILITGFYSTSLEQRAKSTGFCKIIEKPMVNQVLQDTLATTLHAA